jgi:hypothetical protein
MASRKEGRDGMPQMDERERVTEQHDDRNDPNEWEQAPTEVRVQSPRTEVVSFRLPSDQLDLIEELAEQSGQSLSEFLRHAVLSYVRGEALEPALAVHSGGSGKTQVTVITTYGRIGRTSAPNMEWIPDEPPKTVTLLGS